MDKFLRPFNHVIYDTTLAFILSSTITSLFFYSGEIDRTESNIILGVSIVSTVVYYFFAYKSKK
jgi:hypothetical protein